MRLVLSLVSGLCLLAAGGCRSDDRVRAADRPGGSEQPVLVEVRAVQRGPIRETLRLTGTLMPASQATVYSMLPGVVQSLHVQEGDRVTRGQVLARIERGKLALGLRQARAALELARVKLQQARTNHLRVRRLAASAAAPGAQLEQARAGFDAARLQVEQARVAVGVASSRLADAVIRAPISGVVIQRFVQRGNMVTATRVARTYPLVLIGDLRQMKLTVAVPEREMARVALGQRAEVEADAYAGQRFEGKVTRLPERVDPATRTAPVELTIDNELERPAGGAAAREDPLKPGMFARARLVVARRGAAVVVDQDAILELGNRPHALIVREGVVVRRDVTLGIRDGRRYEITRGLAPGDPLIVLGHRLVTPGQPVRTATREVAAGR